MEGRSAGAATAAASQLHAARAHADGRRRVRNPY